MTAARVFRRMEGVYRRVVTRQIPRQRVLARVMSYDYQILRLSGSRDNKAVLAACVAKIRAESQESLAAHVIVLGAVVARGGPCGFCWRSGSLVLVAICRGACQSCWFYQAKA